MTTKDLIGQIKDDWWVAARGAERWKGRFGALTELFGILTDKDEIPREFLDIEIKDHKKANDFMKLLIDYLVKEKHVFTRIGIFTLLDLCIKAFPKKVVAKYDTQFFESVMTLQWAEKKKPLMSLITPVAIRHWVKTACELKSDTIKPHLLAALKSKKAEVRYAACDFLGQACMHATNNKTLKKR
eukprot:406125_1